MLVSGPAGSGTEDEQVARVLAATRGDVTQLVMSPSVMAHVHTLAWVVTATVWAVARGPSKRWLWTIFFCTTTAKHELVVVMAEHDGAGYSLGYLLRRLVEASSLTAAVRAATKVARQEGLENLLLALRSEGVRPA
jgi:hypothetical protein